MATQPPCWTNPGSFANLDTRSRELFNFERRGSAASTSPGPAAMKFTMIWPNFKPNNPTSRFWSTTVFVHNLVPYYVNHPHLPATTSSPTSSGSGTSIQSQKNDISSAPTLSRLQSRAMYAADISVCQRFFGYIMNPQNRFLQSDDVDDNDDTFIRQNLMQRLQPRFGGIFSRSADFVRRHVLEKQMNIESLFDLSHFTVKAGAQYFFSPHLSYNMKLRLGESPTRKMIASWSNMIDIRSEALCCNANIDPEKVSLSGVYRTTWEDRALFGMINMPHDTKTRYRSYIDLGAELAGTRALDSGNVSGGIRFVTKVNSGRGHRKTQGCAPLLPTVDREVAQQEYVFVLGGDVLGHFSASVTYLSEILGLNWSTKYQLNTTNGYSTVGCVVEWRPRLWRVKDFVLRFMLSNYTGTHASITKHPQHQHVSGTISPVGNGHTNGNGNGTSKQTAAVSTTSPTSSSSPSSSSNSGSHPVEFQPMGPDFEVALGTEFRVGKFWNASISLSSPSLAVVRFDNLKWGVELVYGGV